MYGWVMTIVKVDLVMITTCDARYTDDVATVKIAQGKAAIAISINK